MEKNDSYQRAAPGIVSDPHTEQPRWHFVRYVPHDATTAIHAMGSTCSRNGLMVADTVRCQILAAAKSTAIDMEWCLLTLAI